jgi:hypothetical protein
MQMVAPGAAPWSKEDGGLSARLRVERENLHPGFRYAVFLELRNVSTGLLVCTNQPGLVAELTDSKGNPVPPAGLPASGPVPNASELGLAPRSYGGFRVDAQTVGIPVGKTILLAVGNPASHVCPSQTWSLSEGRYTLRARASFPPGGNAGFWYFGNIELPPVEIVVSKKDLLP